MLFHKNVLRDCIRVRGLHLVLTNILSPKTRWSIYVRHCTTIQQMRSKWIKGGIFQGSKIRPPFWGAEIEMPSVSIGTQMTWTGPKTKIPQGDSAMVHIFWCCRLTMAMVECSAQHQWDSRSILQCWVGKCNIEAVFSANEKTVSFTKSCKNHALSMVFWGPRYVVLNSVVLSTLAEVLSS